MEHMDMENNDVVPFNKEAVRTYLDDAIKFWRSARDRKGAMTKDQVDLKSMSPYYIDAYQSVRISLFGETLP